MEYEARQKAIRDYNYLMYQSKHEGIKEGEELLKKSKIETAKKLLLMGLSTEQIIEATDLTIDQVKEV